MCAQRRLRSACASAQSDLSLCCPLEDALDPWVPTECSATPLITDQTVRMCRLIWDFAVRTCNISGNAVSRLIVGFMVSRFLYLYTYCRTCVSMDASGLQVSVHSFVCLSSHVHHSIHTHDIRMLSHTAFDIRMSSHTTFEGWATPHSAFECRATRHLPFKCWATRHLTFECLVTRKVC